MAAKQGRKSKASPRTCRECDNEVPAYRGDSPFCSDICNASRKKRKRSEASEPPSPPVFSQEGPLSFSSDIVPSSDLIPLQAISEGQELEKVESANINFDQAIHNHWLQGETFLEVFKFDHYDYSKWDGVFDNPRWVPVPPVRIWTPLNALALEQAVLSHNPTGGHFQIRLCKGGLNSRAIIRCFYFHFANQGDFMNEMNPVTKMVLDDTREERKQKQELIERMEREKLAQTDKLLELTEKRLDAIAQENSELRKQILLREAEERRISEESRRYELNQNNTTADKLQRAHEESLKALTEVLGVSATRSSSEGASTMAMMMQFMQMNLEQQRQDAERQERARREEQDRRDKQHQLDIERQRIDRDLEFQKMKFMMDSMNRPSATSFEESPMFQMLAARNERLEEQIFGLLQSKHTPPPPEKSKIELAVEKRITDDIERVVSGGSLLGDKGEPTRDYFDKFIDLFTTVGGDKVISRYVDNLSSEPTKPVERGDPDLRQVGSGQNSYAPPPQRAIPQHGRPAPIPPPQRPPPEQPSSHRPPETQTQTPSHGPEESTMEQYTSAIQRIVEAINNREPAKDFADKLEPHFKTTVLSLPLEQILDTAKFLGTRYPALKTPYARRFIEDAYKALQEGGAG